MKSASKQTFERENSNCFPHRIARNPQRGGERQLLQLGAGTKFAFEDALANQSCHLVRDTDTIDLNAIHDVGNSCPADVREILPRIVHNVKC